MPSQENHQGTNVTQNSDQPCQVWRANDKVRVRRQVDETRVILVDDRQVDSRFKCDTELTSKCLQGGLEGEAFAGRGVEGPKQGVEVAIAIA
jgi:hypothetical protein